MCGRYFLDTLPELLAGQFRVHKYPVYSASYNIAPTQPALAVRRPVDENEWALLRWGLVPHWAKDLTIGARTLNARGESIAEKPAFRGAFRYRRCILPASGFFEWQATPNGKQPFAIVPTDLPCFGFAGLWEHWTSPDGSVVESVAVVTTAANALMAPIHDRMPVIIEPGDFDMWLDPHTKPADAQTLVRPYALPMHAYRVSTRVNSPRFDDPACIEPLA